MHCARPWTILRTTQFHDLVLTGLSALARLPARRVVPVRVPGATFAGFARGDHLAPDRAVGAVGFDEFLAQHVSGATGRC